jgi:hypothetical protein
VGSVARGVVNGAKGVAGNWEGIRDFLKGGGDNFEVDATSEVLAQAIGELDATIEEPARPNGQEDATIGVLARTDGTGVRDDSGAGVNGAQGPFRPLPYRTPGSVHPTTVTPPGFSAGCRARLTARASSSVVKGLASNSICPSSSSACGEIFEK